MRRPAGLDRVPRGLYGAIVLPLPHILGVPGLVARNVLVDRDIGVGAGNVAVLGLGDGLCADRSRSVVIG